MISFNNDDQYAVIVIGAGHAGCEAAAAAARVLYNNFSHSDSKKNKVLLITKNISDIGTMSCNPALGGIGKGHIMHEIDAFSGVMCLAADKSTIHKRILNSSKGPAVQGPRSQIDRKLYKKEMYDIMIKYPNLDILYDSVEDLIIDNDDKSVTGVITQNNNVIKSLSVILTTGTFLDGAILVGKEKTVGGRRNENLKDIDESSLGLSKTLQRLNFAINRLKTGTPPRLDRNTINWSILEKQPGDDNPKPFSILNDKIETDQVDCYITYTNHSTHEIIRENISKSATREFNITAKSPRYCPSIEDKITRFADKDRHQVFLEPEGIDSDLIYPNGISNALPQDIQLLFLRSIKGLENVEMVSPGYAIEYNFVDPRELFHTLETKKINNLFFAGQINGTTGYEEAAGQGMVAGVNAALKSVDNNLSFRIERHEGYIGVMIDDLVTKGTSEPYRMFTSRAEYRLILRYDNAYWRLFEKANFYKIISKDTFKKISVLFEEEKLLKDFLEKIIFTPNQLNAIGIKVSNDGVKKSAYELLSLPDFDFNFLENIYNELKSFSNYIKQKMKTDAFYRGYLDKQMRDIALIEKQLELKIPEDLDIFSLQSLSTEEKEKLKLHNPRNVRELNSIPGITPNAVTAVIVKINSLKNVGK